MTLYRPHQYGNVAGLMNQVAGFINANRGNARRVEIGYRVLGLLQMSHWAYGEKRGEYLAKAQGAFRLAFM